MFVVSHSLFLSLSLSLSLLPPSLPLSLFSFFLQAITNFVAYKFNNLPQADWQMMYDLAKMFLYCFNHWKLETPTNHAHSSPTDDHKVYKENYTRQERGKEGEREGGREGE